MSEGHVVQARADALSASWFAGGCLLFVSSHACFGPEREEAGSLGSLLTRG